MKTIFIGLFVFLLAFTPAFVMNTVIMPQMKTMQTTYSHADAVAQNAAGVYREQ